MKKFLYLGAAVLGVAFGQFPHEQKRITLDDVLAVAGPGVHVLSPDGRQFAVIQKGQIALQPSSGGPAVPLTTTPGAKSEPRWSPDGRKLAFVCNRAIWVVDAGGGNPLRLTDGVPGPGDPRGAADHSPRWNPKGQWILFETGRHGRNEIYVVSEDGGSTNYLAATEFYDERRYWSGRRGDDDGVAAGPFDSSPVWSPDGARLLYTERSREAFAGTIKALAFDRATGRARGAPAELYRAKADRGGGWAIDKIAWSPDGNSLALILQDTGWEKVYLIPASGGAPKQLTQGEYEDYAPVFSPDGKRLAVVSNRNVPEERHVWIVPVDGSTPHQLADLPLGVEADPQWSLDGSEVYFVRSSPLESSNLWVASTTGGHPPKRLTQTLPLNFQAAKFEMPERVRYRSKDGRQISAILYKPRGYVQGMRYPAVLSIHGGPEGQDLLTFSPWYLYLAQEGYAVLLPNYRGSIGYGEKFRNLNVEDSGGGEIDDVAAGAQYLVDRGIADPKRLAIAGGSHGGTVVAHAVVKYPDLFAAAIELYGVVDRATYNERTNRSAAVRWEIKMGGTPQEKPEVYRNANVLLSVAKIRTPLLIMHGEEDPQVPPYESAQFVNALKRTNKTFWYFTYPHEGHGFQQPDHRMDSMRKQVAFLNKYLQPSWGQSITSTAEDAIFTQK